MQVVNVVIGIVAFLLVAGYAVLAWFRRGRDPVYLDDTSILLPAPPPGMTAATATVVAGGGGRVAFMAALLDLASRDEIAFVAEGRDGRADRVGIAFHGGETQDPRVLLNRRNPAGEGETWLLGELKAWHAMAGGRAALHDGTPSPEAVAAGLQMMASLMRVGVATAEDDDSFAARAAREHGLSSLAMPDPSDFERAYEARTGHPMKDEARQGLERMMTGMSALADPAAIARDPDHYVGLLESMSGRTLTDDEREQARDQLGAWAAQATAPGAAAGTASAAAGAPGSAASASGAAYLPAGEARRIQAPFLFGALLQTYAKRHGWVGGLPMLASLRWYALAALELVLGIALAATGSSAAIEPMQWLGGGVVAGGLATWVVARSMPALSKEGAEMKAQLAAYRRTLAATFAQASSLDQVVAAHRLPWLESPDQALVWGVALGLRHEIEALLARTGQAIAGGGATAATYVPPWYTAGSASGPATTASGPGLAPAPAPIEDPAAMFAGIETIGSEATTPHSQPR